MRLTELRAKLNTILEKYGDGELSNFYWRGQWVIEVALDKKSTEPEIQIYKQQEVRFRLNLIPEGAPGYDLLLKELAQQLQPEKGHGLTMAAKVLRERVEKAEGAAKGWFISGLNAAANFMKSRKVTASDFYYKEILALERLWKE